MTTQQQREAFEVWFKNEFGRPSKPAREGASYAHPMACSAWRAWQAAQAQQSHYKALLIEHALNHDNDSEWDEADWHERVCEAVGGDLEHPQPAQQVPEGWKLVPEDPTDEMIGAGAEASRAFRVDILRSYEAMLAASPTPDSEDN